MRFQLIFILFHLFRAKDPFKVYVETISANDRCIDICIDLQWVVNVILMMMMMDCSAK